MKKVIFNIIFKKDNLVKKVVFLSPKWKKLITFFKLTKAKERDLLNELIYYFQKLEFY